MRRTLIALFLIGCSSDRTPSDDSTPDTQPFVLRADVAQDDGNFTVDDATGIGCFYRVTETPYIVNKGIYFTYGRSYGACLPTSWLGSVPADADHELALSNVASHIVIDATRSLVCLERDGVDVCFPQSALNAAGVAAF